MVRPSQVLLTAIISCGVLIIILGGGVLVSANWNISLSKWLYNNTSNNNLDWNETLGEIEFQRNLDSDCVVDYYMYGAFDNGTPKCRADQGGAGSYDFNFTNGSVDGVITDGEVFAIKAGNGITVEQSGNNLTLINDVIDTNCDGGSCNVANTGTLDGYEASELLDNTDSQTLSYDSSNEELSISGGNTVDITRQADDTFFMDVQNIINETVRYNISLVNGSNAYHFKPEATRHVLMEGVFQ